MRKRHDPFVVGVHFFVFAVLMSFAINIGFIVDVWLGPVFTDAVTGPMLRLIAAIVTGACLGLGSYGLYLKSERAFQTIRLTAGPTELWIRGGALILVNLLVIGVDIAGLIYRSQFLNQHGVGWIIYIGVALAFFCPLIALVVHPLQHQPVEMIEDELLDDFQRSHVREAYSKIRALPINQRHRAFTGRIDEVLDDAVEAETQDREAKKQIAPPKSRPLTSMIPRFTKALPTKASQQGKDQ